MIQLTDFRVEKRLKFGAAKSLALRFNAFNLFNASTITATSSRPGRAFNTVTAITRADSANSTQRSSSDACLASLTLSVDRD